MGNTLYIIIPCYNEEQVLPVTAPLFLGELQELITKEKVSKDSRILFVDDGSKDKTWEIISGLAKEDEHYRGIAQSRNRGHQNALFAGMMEARDLADLVITIDCDGQDDIHAMEEMVDQYHKGCQIVYGVRKDRSKDSFFKRSTARGYYRILAGMGADVVYDHADYRLVTKEVLLALSSFEEVNLYLRGLFPLVGFTSTSVYYERQERMAGKTHYPLHKMLRLGFDGITGFSVRPLQWIINIGLFVAFLGLCGIIWAFVEYFRGSTIAGWASMICIVCFLGGIQLLSLGVIGEYIGKIYMETKHRPRYIISRRTFAHPGASDVDFSRKTGTFEDGFGQNG